VRRGARLLALHRWRAAAEQMIALPMSAGVESLNVAVAAGIALYALRP